ENLRAPWAERFHSLFRLSGRRDQTIFPRPSVALFRFHAGDEQGGDYWLPKSSSISEDWHVTFADTGLDTNTGGRVKRVEQYIGGDETFCVTYGDGLANIDLPVLLGFHRSHGHIATITAVHPRSNFGLLKLDVRGEVTEFEEKPVIADWINGGFFV